MLEEWWNESGLSKWGTRVDLQNDGTLLFCFIEEGPRGGQKVQARTLTVEQLEGLVRKVRSERFGWDAADMPQIKKED
jgi:hypothetical protein